MITIRHEVADYFFELKGKKPNHGVCAKAPLRELKLARQRMKQVKT